MYNYIYQTLYLSSYITTYREENIKQKGYQELDVSEVNEYAKSMAGLVIYKRIESQVKLLKCCLLTVAPEQEQNGWVGGRTKSKR